MKGPFSLLRQGRLPYCYVTDLPLGSNTAFLTTGMPAAACMWLRHSSPPRAWWYPCTRRWRGGLNVSPVRGARKRSAIRSDGKVHRIVSRGTAPLRETARPGQRGSFDRARKVRRRVGIGCVGDGNSIGRWRDLRDGQWIVRQRIAAGRRACRLIRGHVRFNYRPRPGDIANRRRSSNRRCGRRTTTSSTTASGHNGSQQYCNQPTQWPENISEAIHRFPLVMGCRKTSLCG